MIVTDVGGNAEAVVDRETGLIVPAKDPGRLADAILTLASDPTLRGQYGAAGHRRVCEHFAMERSVAGYEMLYRTLLGGRRARRYCRDPGRLGLAPALAPGFEHKDIPKQILPVAPARKMLGARVCRMRAASR